MVYGRLLLNNIKEYTPAFVKSIPYAQTVKPVFGHQPSRISKFNQGSGAKTFWRFIENTFQRYQGAWWFLVVGCNFNYICNKPWESIYIKNNQHRSFEVAKAKEVAHKVKMAELEEQEEDDE